MQLFFKDNRVDCNSLSPSMRKVALPPSLLSMSKWGPHIAEGIKKITFLGATAKKIRFTTLSDELYSSNSLSKTHTKAYSHQKNYSILLKGWLANYDCYHKHEKSGISAPSCPISMMQLHFLYNKLMFTNIYL